MSLSITRRQQLRQSSLRRSVLVGKNCALSAVGREEEEEGEGEG